MAAFGRQDSRPLRKPRLGPPDVYPQDPKQKEDEITVTSVKMGFSNLPHFNDEYGSAKNVGISQEMFGAFFSAVLSKKIETNTCPDSSKKKLQLMKDNFWPVTSQKRPQMENWFKDLAGGKPLVHLMKRIPTFNKKDEIFTILCDAGIPMLKATWFIKITSAYYLAMQENKPKKRQAIDQSLEWTVGVTKFMKEQLLKVQEHYHGGSSAGPVTSFLTATQAPSVIDHDAALKHWGYACRLSRHMYDEGLLDRHEFLTWFIEMIEKMKLSDDTILKMILAQLLQYLDEVKLSAQLGRRLAYACSKKVAQMCSESGCTSPRTQSPMLNNSANGSLNNNNNNNNHQQLLPQNPIAAIFSEYNSCPQHRGIILSLSACLQIITMTSPSALVWNNLTEGRSNSPYSGSPLDLLPCPPSCLPMPPGDQNPQIRSQIRAMEHQIRLRGRAAEVKWSSDKCQQSSTGYTIGKVLEVLDTLDRHNFDKVEVNNCLESLYNKIFASSHNKDGNEPLVSDDPIITLLIDWAVSSQRHGAHRAVVVAKLLEKRQNDLRADKYGDSDTMDDKDSVGSDMMVPPGVPTFQGLLLHFLDAKAPVLDDSQSEENLLAFANLIHLFSELIRHDVFSHDAYMCTLISRGDLISSPAVATLSADSVDLSSIISQFDESIKHEHQDDIKVDIDMHTMETDLGSLFGSVKDEPRLSPDPPASMKSIKSEKEDPIPSVGPKSETLVTQEQKGPSRHMLYATHFPLQQDEMTNHECNQRLVVLFGVGKGRDNARHIIKRITKEILRLYSKKNCIDVSSGDLGKAKKKKEKDELSVSLSMPNNMEVIFGKFQRLSYYDQHAVVAQCLVMALEQISLFTNRASTYLPQVENISYLFDLMEYSMNINTLLEFSIQLLKELSIVESNLQDYNSSLSGNYTTSLCLCIVAIFRKYHSFLLVSEDLTFQAFEGLIGVVKHVCNPADCSSAERCILAYLYDVYTSCSYLKNKFQEMFSNAYSKIRVTLYAEIIPSVSNLMWDPTFMIDFLENAKGMPVEPQILKQLNDQPACRYSLVCNSMLNICKYGLCSDRLNEISVLCAELTARCNLLSSEWLGVLKALCCSSNHNCGYIDVLTQIDVSDLSFHDNLAVFTAILIARHCFSLQDLIGFVALPSLVNPAFDIKRRRKESDMLRAGGDADAEPGARLTCHLLLRLFRVARGVLSPYQINTKVTHIKASCDRHLLAAAHDNIDVGAVLAVLKAMLALGDCDDKKSKAASKKEALGDDIISSLLSSLDDDINMDMMLGPSASNAGLENAGLSEYSKHSLREMCSQDWVREKFLRDPEGLFTPEMLLDTMLRPEQAQQLVEMICYPAQTKAKVDFDEELDNKEIINRILQNLDQWTLRVSLLELNLMFKQAQSNSETNSILDDISQATIHLFHQQTEHHSRTTNNSQAAALLDMPVQSPKNQNSPTEKDNSVWMVAPLISKLPSGVQGRVLKQAGQVLENSNTFLAPKSKLDKERNQRSKSLLSHQPFLSLILACLKGQDEQREGLLSSLLTQLEKFIQSFTEMLEKYPDESKIRSNIHETLVLRLSLVGGMFDTIQRNTGVTTDWTILLVQLINSGVVDMQSNYELFTTVLDMLNCLLLGTLIPDPTEKTDDTKKIHGNLVKKLRKEMGDKYFEATDQIRQLLPLPKRYYEVVTVEPHGTLVDTKGNKIQGFDSIKRKQGLQVGKMEQVNPWDVIEGTKNPPPLSWTYFGSVKLEKKPLKYAEQHRLLLYHTHSLLKPISYYLDPPVLPPEELEPPPEKIQEEKPSIERTESVQSDTGGKKQKPARRRRQSRVTNNNNSYTQPTLPRQYGSYQDQMYQQPAPPPNWYGTQQSQPAPPYISQPAMPSGGSPRFAPPFSSKQAIQTMIRNRQPGTPGSFMPQSHSTMQSLQMMQKQRQQQLVRQKLTYHSQNRMGEGQGVYGSGMGQMTPGSGMMPISQAPMSQPYSSGGYGGVQSQQPMDNMGGGGGMMSQGYNQTFQGGQNQPMMSSMSQQPQQPGYMSQQGQPSQTPYSATSRIPMSSGSMQNNTSMGSYNQMGPTPSTPQGGPSYMQRIPTPQQQQRLQHMRQQQQMMMQQQQKQQMSSNQQQQTAALVAQLQRKMVPTPGQQPGPGPAPQYNSYQQQPPQY